MNSHAVMEYSKTQIDEYVAELLTLGICDLFFKTVFVEQEDKIMLNCQTEGFKSLDSMSELSTEEILSVAVSLLHGFYQSESHFLFTELFSLHPRWIFTDRSFSQIKMIFVPAEKKEPFPLKMDQLLKELKSKCHGEGTGYIDSACNFILEDEYGYKSLIHQLENLRREVYLCGVK